MKIILPLLSLFLIIFILGCGKEEITEETIYPKKITAKVSDIEEVEVPEEDKEIKDDVEEDIVTVKLCHDTDRGIVRWVNGSIFGFHDNAERFEYKDFCFDNNFLIEFYCENEMPQNASFLCDNGCEDNHCL